MPMVPREVVRCRLPSQSIKTAKFKNEQETTVRNTVHVESVRITLMGKFRNRCPVTINSPPNVRRTVKIFFSFMMFISQRIYS